MILMVLFFVFFLLILVHDFFLFSYMGEVPNYYYKWYHWKMQRFAPQQYFSILCSLWKSFLQIVGSLPLFLTGNMFPYYQRPEQMMTYMILPLLIRKNVKTQNGN